MALTMLAACSLIFSALSVPRMIVLSYRAPDLPMADARVVPSPHRAAPHARAHRAQRPDISAPPIVSFRQVSPPPDLNFPVVLPTLSPDSRPVETAESDSFVSSSSKADSAEYSPSPVWDESPPQAPRRRASKIGSIALRALQVGIGIAASQIGDHEHEKEH